MVRNLKALMYSGSINGADFASFTGFWGELHEICMIRWKFAKNLNLKILLINLKMKKEMCTVKPYYIFSRKKCVRLSCIIFLAERFRLFAMRLPSLSRGNGLLGCGITFDIFTHVLHGSFLFALLLQLYKKCKCTNDDLVDGYNVAHLQYKTIQNIGRIM